MYTFFSYVFYLHKRTQIFSRTLTNLLTYKRIHRRDKHFMAVAIDGLCELVPDTEVVNVNYLLS